MAINLQTDDLPNRRESLAEYLAGATGARSVRIEALSRLSGGAIQENWKLTTVFDGGSINGKQDLVLRTDSLSALDVSHGRAQEFALLKAAEDAGVTVPKPLLLCNDLEVIGRPFYLMPFLQGIALGPKVVKDRSIGGDREQLGYRLGRELGCIHSIRPPRNDLCFLPLPSAGPVATAIEDYRTFLDRLDEARPALEWGMSWCLQNAPEDRSQPVLIHQDFRTGNLLLDHHGLVAILDWEFAAWGDPNSDLGWFCAACWRFGRPDLEAGGISSRAAFYQGYQDETGTVVDDGVVRFWEIMAHIRWAVIALQQGARHHRGEELSLELALTGRIAAELELQILRMTRP
ncbi:aminoglycoside phosphotransferase (APT) family kinase protein [Limibacillus sp. MBR-115]|jgi:aminoglycoside phosphotransferase (APT) family kinase protein